MITNKNDFPEPLAKAVELIYYKGDEQSDITCTQLIDDPAYVALKKKYADKIDEDVSDRIWALLGNAMHSICERMSQEMPEYKAEQRLRIAREGWVISGQYDLYHVPTKTLYDFKLCSVWEVINGVKQEKKDQMNVLTTLLEENNYIVDKAYLVLVFRDWSKTKATEELLEATIRNQTPSYPVAQAMLYEVEIKSKEERELYISDRVKLHQNAQVVADQTEQDCFPHLECSKHGRWQDEDKWAVMKGKIKRAVRVFDKKEDAEEYIKNSGDDSFFIQYREGEPRRCLAYCPVKNFCKFYNKYSILKEGRKND